MKSNVSNMKKWDTHHHISPDFYEAFIIRNGYEDGVYGLPHTKWSPELMLKWMDGIHLERAVMSISMPGVHFGDDAESRQISRQCNDYMAGLIKEHPDRLGGFAAVPLPDVEGAVQEAEYALDRLKLDGIGLVSNLNNRYFGDPEFEAFWQALNRRKAVVYVHPRRPEETVGYKMLNYTHHIKNDTSKAIVDYMRAGYHKKFPDIKFFLSHGGGTLATVMPDVLEQMEKENPRIRQEFEEWRGQLFADTALCTYTDEMFPTVLNFFGANHMIFGTDLCWAVKQYKYYLQKLSDLDVSEDMFEDMFINNVRRAFSEERVPYKPIKIKPNSAARPKSVINHHVHISPEEVVEFVSSRIGHSHKSDYPSTIGAEHCNTMLSLDLSDIWNLSDKDKRSAIGLFNSTITAMRDKSEVNSQVLAAIDLEDPEFSIKEIDRCINDLKMDGICLYVRDTGKKYDDMFDDRLLVRLEEVNVPVVVHPKASDKMPVLDIEYYDTPAYFNTLVYLDKLEHLKSVNYIPTHTGGLLDFLSHPMNTVHYVEPATLKPRIGKIIWEMLIKKREVYHEYISQLQHMY